MLELERFIGKSFNLELTKAMRITNKNGFLSLKAEQILCFCPIFRRKKRKREKFTHFTPSGKFNLYINVKNPKDIRKLSHSCQLVNV